MSIAVTASNIALPVGGTGTPLSPTGISAGTVSGAEDTPFADLFSDAVGTVGQLQDQAHATVTGLLTGSGVDVHTAMIATEKADMAFELAIAVRNKAVQAYQQVVGMQF